MNDRLLSRLRCPDCLGSPVSETVPESEDRPLDPPVRRFTCGACGRVLLLSEGILRALPSEFPAEVAANLQYYDEMSEQASQGHLFRRGESRNHGKKQARVLESLRLSDSSGTLSVLEIGAGQGAHGAAVQARGHQFIGLDISPGLLQQAMRRHPQLSESLLVSGDACRLPFTDGAFDRVFCVATLHHLPDPASGLKEMVRVLAPGGRYCIMEPKRFYPTQVFQALTHPQTEVSWLQVHVASLRRWLTQAGVRDIRVEHVIYTPNRPQAFHGLYDRVDGLCRRLGLSALSVVLCISGVKED